MELVSKTASRHDVTKWCVKMGKKDSKAEQWEKENEKWEEVWEHGKEIASQDQGGDWNVIWEYKGKFYAACDVEHREFDNPGDAFEYLCIGNTDPSWDLPEPTKQWIHPDYEKYKHDYKKQKD